MKSRRQAVIIEVVDRIKELLPSLRASLPAGIEIEILTDRTHTIRASVGSAVVRPTVRKVKKRKHV